jgi:RNA polymerase sigma factor (sigma-70 family)
MADLDGDLREALRQIRQHGAHSARGSEAWLTVANIVKHVASQARYASVPAAVVDADDVAASMLVRLQSPPLRQRIVAARSPAAYLRGMARYALIDLLRKVEATVPIETNISKIAAPCPSATASAGGRNDVAVERLRSAIAALSPSEQMLVRQRFWEGMSVADIARSLGEPYSRVAVRMFRLTRKLRRALEDVMAPRLDI